MTVFMSYTRSVPVRVQGGNGQQEVASRGKVM